MVLAADGMEGIEQFRANKPDLVLLDLMLPKIDGFAVCEILRKESHVPIIMLTALDDDDSQMKGFDALADDYIKLDHDREAGDRPFILNVGEISPPRTTSIWPAAPVSSCAWAKTEN